MLSSSARIAANQRNAALSTGPRTIEGKARVARNGIRHGVRSEAPVLNGLERMVDWQAHRQAILDDLDPVGAVETAFVERIALQLWRLQRIVRFESAAGVSIVADQPRPSDGAGMRALGILTNRDREALIANDHAAEFLVGVASVVGHPLPRGIEAFRPSDAPSGHWRARHLHGVLAGFCKQHSFPVGQVVKELTAAALGQADYPWAAAPKLPRRAELDTGVLELTARYEGTLEKSLLRILHEFQRLRANREGAPLMPPAALDVAFSSG